MTVALVLAGGASLGAVQVGMLAALAERDVVPDLLVGTSAGALNAAYLAGRSLDQNTVAGLSEVWCGLSTWSVFRPEPRRALAMVAGRGASLFGDRGLRELAERHLDFDQLQDAAIPLSVVATDLLTGEKVVFRDGSAVTAILASSAIPGISPSVRRDGHDLVDGGLADNAAISTAIAAGAERVYVLPCGYPCALAEAPRSGLGRIAQAMSLLTHQRLIHDLDLYRHRAELVVLPPPCPISISPMDFRHAPDLISRAREAATRFLDIDDGLRRDPVGHIAMHTHHR